MNLLHNEIVARRYALDLEIFQRFLQVLRSDLPREQRNHELINLRFALEFVSPIPPAPHGLEIPGGNPPPCDLHPVPEVRQGTAEGR
jgi:hypothetical protein